MAFACATRGWPFRVRLCPLCARPKVVAVESGLRKRLPWLLIARHTHTRAALRNVRLHVSHSNVLNESDETRAGRDGPDQAGPVSFRGLRARGDSLEPLGDCLRAHGGVHGRPAASGMWLVSFCPTSCSSLSYIVQIARCSPVSGVWRARASNCSEWTRPLDHTCHKVTCGRRRLSSDKFYLSI